MTLFSRNQDSRNAFQDYDDLFLQTINQVFSIARYIGISTVRSKGFVAWTIIVFLVLAAIEVAAIWKLARLLAGWASNTSGERALVGRVSGSIFYGNAMLSLIFSIRFLSSWKSLSRSWFKADMTVGFKLPIDHKIRRRSIVVTICFTAFAIVEHILSMMSATGLDCPLEEYFERYILSSHGFLMQTNEYKLWLAIPIFILSKVATLLWTFQDLVIILISMGLTSRYYRLNTFVQQVVRRKKKNEHYEMHSTDPYVQTQTWRKVREAYVRQASLVRKVDRQLGSLMFLSNANNLYFICLQLFNGIGKISGSLMHQAYYFLSLGWLLFRGCSVVLAASDIHSHSTMALPSLYRCSRSRYNIEIKRLINQMLNDDITLTGKGFFKVNRKLLLQVAAVILKYELVLLQYDKN